jgi:hypothetical protein
VEKKKALTIWLHCLGNLFINDIMERGGRGMREGDFFLKGKFLGEIERRDRIKRGNKKLKFRIKYMNLREMIRESMQNN